LDSVRPRRGRHPSQQQKGNSVATTERRRLDVRAASPYPAVAHRRQQFDRHVTECEDCQPELCGTANAMWRALCLSALRQQQTAGIVDGAL